MSGTSGLETPTKRKGNAAAAATAATAVGKQASSGKGKKKQPACTFDGCNQEHYLYKCPKFENLPVPERKKFVKKIGACQLCLNKGHRYAECPRKEKLSGCRSEGCDQPHSTLLHESVADGQAAAVYEAPFVPEVNLMMMLQIIDVVDHMSRKVPATVMWDSGANLTMITAEFSQRLKLPKTGHSAKISLAGGSIQT